MSEGGGVPDMRKPTHLLAFGFGSGLLPKAPGTYGTLVGVPLYLLMQPLPLLSYILLVALGFVAGLWLCQRAAEDLGVHDHSGIVWDEMVGYLAAMAFAPPGWIWIVIGFLLFRLFDIFKPWPIRWIDRRVKGGLGIMLDDLAAGIYSAGAISLLNLTGWI
ncbi:MAG: phosphatidylglycerophosphatase A [gamma proteobacterium symbiont of Ctena orbiculata]|nr:phosphatidylglycerophosphatase A [Candidatus Thiodiazotropha sp. (ex Lucina pensylvanica)]MBT3063408.1 phosphatidylglycerophosphatase A [Candidatus Thiodiazotropha sp. (ex Lucina pensylvanica)]PUB77071.1 MAG: phosphatidylglycerophosphatase A [gamma proteobacterium symbiont of Ctena orbiculata]